MINDAETIRADDFNIFQGFLAGEDIAAGDTVAMHSDFTILQASSAAYNTRLNFIGFAIEAATTGNLVKIDIQLIVSPSGASLTSNTLYYLSDTPGAIATSAGTFERRVGRSISTSTLIRLRGVVSPFIQVVSGRVSSTPTTETTVAPCLMTVHPDNNPTEDYINYDGYEYEDRTSSKGKPLILPAHETLSVSFTGDLIVELLDFGGVI